MSMRVWVDTHCRVHTELLHKQKKGSSFIAKPCEVENGVNSLKHSFNSVLFCLFLLLPSYRVG